MKYLIAAAVFYVLMVIVCFGPATMQSAHARDAYLRTCKEGDYICVAKAPREGDGFFKAMLWPFWFSYTIALHFDAAPKPEVGS